MDSSSCTQLYSVKLLAWSGVEWSGERVSALSVSCGWCVQAAVGLEQQLDTDFLLSVSEGNSLHYLPPSPSLQDKKPVGIVCLPDYESCHKAEVKVWKKQHSFMLDRGNVSCVYYYREIGHSDNAD